MAKTKPERGAKAAAIREHFATNPKAKASEVIAALASKGLKVSPPMIYVIRNKDKKKQRKAARVERVAKVGVTNPVLFLTKVKSLAMEAGGMKNLKAFVDALVG